ncbi:hypothetical protein Salat_1673600 [Sesamum alatum]|uniref:Uncharacterized protein n=1 Tax=Sesamum alatum TaxID=300844 RepID=A0AAE1Y749_9LAMI|nr:hypothetical protein Salat_1673600 [Sesamum alatum]
MDDVFIDTLVKEISDLRTRGIDGITVGAICAAQRAVDSRFGKRLSYRYCVECVSQLRERHSTFAWLIGHQGVFWTRRWMQLWADGEVWDAITRERPFAMAYRWRLEPQWEALKFIFGDVDNEDEASSDDGNMDEDTSTSVPTEISISDFLDDTSSSL